MSQRGVLLVNLGSPDSPRVRDIQKFLRAFLMDGRVLDAPWPVRFAIAHFAILPGRPHQSAEAYGKIWTKEGSPLVVTGERVRAALQRWLDFPVELAMRYRNPSIERAIAKLTARGVEDLLLIPMFPHYAMSSFETAAARVQKVLAQSAPQIRLKIISPYYNHPDYIEALVASAAEYLEQDFDHLLFSFHGVPERHLRKSDPTGCHCLKAPDCCDVFSPSHPTCYRAQCFQTVKAFVQRAGLPDGKYSVAFQSRLGRDPWLQPYTDEQIVRLARTSVKRLLVICPAFVSDCLETLEEIGMRGSDSFRAAGGHHLKLIPCLNESPFWIEALERMTRSEFGHSDPDVARANRTAAREKNGSLIPVNFSRASKTSPETVGR